MYRRCKLLIKESVDTLLEWFPAWSEKPITLNESVSDVHCPSYKTLRLLYLAS
jgi:hypothetical protein